MAQALELANKAIHINPACSLAYRVRGVVLQEQGKSALALPDLSHAIELDPKDKIAYEWRAQVYDALNDSENFFLDKARSNRRSAADIGKWPVTEAKFGPWYETIHQHLIGTILPKLANDESIVEYYPCLFAWDKRQEVVSSHRTVFTRTHLKYGTGYIAVTTKNLHLVSLASLSQKFPLYEKSMRALSRSVENFLVDVLDPKNRERQREPYADEKEQKVVEKADQVWTVPHQSVVSAQVAGKFVSLTTPAMTWEIYEHFQDHIRYILIAINLGLSGKYAHLWEVPKAEQNVVAQPSKDIVTLLRELNGSSGKCR